MKQYYESEVLYQLMERDGFNIPSSVPPYESEIKAYLINQVKLAYPKLTDYEAEWLLYNYTKHLPAEFPISSVSNVTEATINNVVPYAYKSAILKGNTERVFVPLKNLFNGLLELGSISTSTGALESNSDYYRNTDFIVVEPSTNYIISTDGISNGRLYYYDSDFNFIRSPKDFFFFAIYFFHIIILLYVKFHNARKIIKFKSKRILILLIMKSQIIYYNRFKCLF